MANENKSNSELYREKRKERLEKVESKKVKSHKGKRSKKLAYALIIVAVIVAISAFFLNFFGVPQRLQSAVITDDGTKISVAEYEYYYRYWFNTYHTQSKQYEDSYASYYGEGAGLMMTGYDANKTPENQKYSGDLDKDKYGKEPTWADFFEDISVQYCFMYDALEKLAIEKGMKITKEEKKELDEHMSSIVAVAKENNFSFDAYLRKTFGNGMNEKLLRRIFEKQTLASKYIETLQEEKKAAVTPEDILKNYNENKNDYNIVDLRMFYNASEPAVAKENEKKTDQELEKETKAAADKVKSDSKSMLDAVTDEASFIRLAKEYATEAMKENYEEESATLTEGSAFKDMSQYISEDAAKWMFDEQRKIGDKNMFTVEHDDGSVNCYVLYILKPSYRDDTPAPVSVRHILVAFDDDPGADGEKKKISKEVKEQ
ncbi:MAG: hypothetical protein LBH71_00200 [Oscillospiraceae bacterium]|jgi:hypothetical protein|nr:hypothetical protein [Oscillospiraceae bacterium]